MGAKIVDLVDQWSSGPVDQVKWLTGLIGLIRLIRLIRLIGKLPHWHTGTLVHWSTGPPN